MPCRKCGKAKGLGAKCAACTRDYRQKRRQDPEVVAAARAYQKAYFKRPDVMARRYTQTRRETRPEVRADHNEKQALRARSASGRRLKFKNHLWRKFRMTVEDYARMLSAQAFCCAACGDPLALDKHTNVDHDHATGKVRGVLCGPCNRALGQARDSVPRLSALIQYLIDSEA